VPFLYGGVEQGHHWLTEPQFVDAVAVATAAALGIFLPVYLSCRRAAGTLVQTVGEEPTAQCICAGRDRRCNGRDCRRRRGSCAPLGLRLAYHRDLRGESSHTLSLEGTRARAHSLRRNGRASATTLVKPRWS
jgi:hypothetical protein